MTHRKGTVLMSMAVASLLTACSQTNPHPEDPLEGLNRHIYGVNRAIDKAIIRPVAFAYYKHTPKETQAGVHNFFGNLDTIPTVANDLLQFKFGLAAHDTSRFLINSTVGLFGLFDVAHKLGLLKRSEDFGQTLYYWGVEESPYLVLPLIGPSTIRDTVGRVVDMAFQPVNYLESDEWRYGLKGLEILDTRANLLRHENVLESVGVDEYAFVRNAYLQRRAFSSYDGKIPIDKQDSDPFEDEAWLDEEDEMLDE